MAREIAVVEREKVAELKMGLVEMETMVLATGMPTSRSLPASFPFFSPFSLELLPPLAGSAKDGRGPAPWVTLKRSSPAAFPFPTFAPSLRFAS